MRCEQYEQDLNVGAAGGTITPEVEAHLAVCAACDGRLAEKRALIASVDRVLTADLDVEPSPALRSHVRARVSGAESERRRAAPRAVAAALAAGLALAVLGGRWAHRPFVPPGPAAAVRIVPDAPAGAAVQREPPAPLRSAPRAAVATATHAHRRATPPTIARSAVWPASEVLVPPGQEDALRRFMAGLREDPHTARPLLRTSASVESPVEPPPLIDIPALAISEPLAEPAERLERSKS
jgi:hypothetical protein